MIQERQPHGHALTSACWSLELSWLLLLEQPGTPTAGCDHAWAHLGGLYFTLQWLKGTGVGVPSSRKAHVGDKAHSPESVSDKNCSHQCSEVCKQCPAAQSGVPKGCAWVPACTGEWAGLHFSSDVITRLEYPDKNIYTLNVW